MTESDGERPRSRIPEFRNYQEEAEFWDLHDTTEFEDEWKPVHFRVAEKLRHGMMVWFDARTLDQLIEYAKAQGVDPGDLGGEWIAERLRAEAPSTAHR